MSFKSQLNFGFSKNLPAVLQTEATECGLACLAMISAHYGYETDLIMLRQRFSISLKGASLKDIIDIAAKLNFITRPVRLEIDDLNGLTLPCILHWDFNHFVVLKEINQNGAIIHDPAYGIRKLELDEVSKHFTGVALQLLPGQHFKVKKEIQTFSWRQLMGNTQGLKSALIKIFGLALALEILVIVGPIINQLIYDHVLVTADRNLLLMVIVGLILLEVIRVSINVVRAWAVMIMSANVSMQWVSNAFSHLLRLPIPWFEKRHIGDVVSRFNGIHAIQGALTTRFIETILDGLLSVGALTMMLIYNAKLTAVVVATVVLYWIIRLAWYGKLKRVTESQIIFGAKQNSYFMESLRAVRTVRLFNATNQRQSTWLNAWVDEQNENLKGQRYDIIIDVTNNVLFMVQNMSVLGFGALAVLDNQWSLGMLLAFMSFKGQFAGRSMALIDKLIDLKMLRIQAERLSDIVITEPEEEYSGSVDVDSLAPSLSVQNVGFKYGDNEPLVLTDFSLEVSQGESIAIIGGSGCGKTTLMKLMLGMAIPNQGEILYGGIPLNKMDLSQYRDMIGVVMQDDQLFSGSIADNISFFSPNADQAHIEACAKIAAIHDEISASPMGYHSLVGDMGTTLSGGQKQRVVLARALYKQPKILFLDEATSHLDIENEKRVNDKLRELGITMIIIAHRPETILMADKILAMEQGQAKMIEKDAFRMLTSAPKI